MEHNEHLIMGQVGCVYHAGVVGEVHSEVVSSGHFSKKGRASAPNHLQMVVGPGEQPPIPETTVRPRRPDIELTGINKERFLKYVWGIASGNWRTKYPSYRQPEQVNYPYISPT